VNPSVPSELVDIVLTHDLSDLTTEVMRVQGKQIRVVVLDDLIAIKKQSNRAQDREDVRALKSLRGKRGKQ
jgi:predicted nucleotidyltransferase